MLRKYHSAITPAVREQQMVGFVLMSMLCCSPAYIPVCIYERVQQSVCDCRIIGLKAYLSPYRRGN
jgi:hypothetical protein